MTALSLESAPAELGVLLNQAVLRLSPDLHVATLGKERVALKYQPGRQYLVVTPLQWETLQEFKNGQTGPAVLCELIASQRNPSLREYYELVVKATRAGILQTPGHPVPAEVTPVKFPLRVNGTVARWLTLAAAIAAVVSLVLRPVQLPEQGLWLVAGWLAVCVAASMGTLLAAGVVRASHGEVYHLRLDWKTPVPRLRAGLGDALLGGRKVETDVALAHLAPHFIFLTVAAWWLPALQLPLLAGVLFVFSPLWRSPLLDLLGALYRDPQIATTYDFVLARDRLFQLLTRARQHVENRRFLFACAGATVAWLALVFLAGCIFLQANAHELVERFRAVGGVRYTAMAAIGFGGLMVLGAAGFAGWIAFSHLWAWMRERAERRLRPAAVLVSPQKIAEWLGRTVLFRELPADDLAAVAASIKPEEHKGGSFVVREGEPGERLYIVLSGRLEVRRDYAPGRSEPVAEMGEGDVFGEIALLQGGPRTRSVRSLGRSVLLGLDKVDFERLVLTKLSRQAVADAVQKMGFLQHTQLTRNWSQATMAAFARRARLQELVGGTVAIKEGAANHWFFLVHRGEFSVELQGRELRRLKQGDMFGELSLMGDGMATATVTASSKAASCLVIAGRDFLEFITHDFTVGLAWEELKTRPREKTARQR